MPLEFSGGTIIIFTTKDFTMKKVVIFAILLLSSCSGFGGASSENEPDYPRTRDQIEADRVGKLTGDEGITLFGGKKKAFSEGINVNSYLWRAILDTIYFMPLASADPFGGVILTDWYQLGSNSNERIKLNIYIIGSELRSDALRVSAFKQINKAGKWVDVMEQSTLASEISDKILLKAREIKVASPL